MAALLHLAKWLAWQLGEADPPQATAGARITVFTTGRHGATP